MFVNILILFVLSQTTVALGLNTDQIDLAVNYFIYKGMNRVCYFTCASQTSNIRVLKRFTEADIFMSASQQWARGEAEAAARQWVVGAHRALTQCTAPHGVLIDSSCADAHHTLNEASRLSLFGSTHPWLVFSSSETETNVSTFVNIENNFAHLNLSIDTDLVVAILDESDDTYTLTDVFNFGKIQGNELEQRFLGKWSSNAGLDIQLDGFKYYYRWNFNNLTLRAISVVLGGGRNFTPSELWADRFTAGVSAMTKVTAQILTVLRDQHNFSFTYTITDRWVGSPAPNSTLAVTNSMHWRQQDISMTCLRIFPTWLNWMDPFFPPTTFLETKFYYLIPEYGVGDYENRFLSPLSSGVWWCTSGALMLCTVFLALAAAFERRPAPGYYAVFSVMAATCQQAYEDGIQILDEAISSQGRRMTLLVIGLTSMLLYNYYTSSVVSWLLNAAAPTIATMDGLIRSDYELTFEDIGYTRQWLEGPGFYYYTGFKSPLEDQLRDKKVLSGKRTTALLHPAEDGIALVRTGKYAYHTEPYTANQVIGRTFEEAELCALGSLQMMPPAPVYIVGQKRSPYRQFFVWSLMRATERGHVSAARRRVGGRVPACSGRAPRALALGQAAPAFAVLAYAFLLCGAILAGEIWWARRSEIRAAAVAAAAAGLTEISRGRTVPRFN